MALDPRPSTTRGTLASDDPERWRAVLARDARRDGTFVFAVVSTGIYCRPSCPSRRPRADRVRFFARAEAAERAGFRSCRRCRPRATGDPQAAWLGRICRYLEAHPEARLAELGAAAGMSPHHLQRTFKRLVGITPCHRVVGAAGQLTGYRWGIERKAKLLAREAAVPGREAPEERTRRLTEVRPFAERGPRRR